MSSIEEATDEVVQALFDNSIQTKPKEMAERVNASLCSIKIRGCSTDPAGSVNEFIGKSCYPDGLQKKAFEIIKDLEICKTLIPSLIGRLEPHQLPQRIINEKAYWTAAQKASFFIFHGTLKLYIRRSTVGRNSKRTVETKG